MRSLRLYLHALGAAMLLAALVFGPPVLLALTIGDPRPDWSALQVGDYSTSVVIDLAACLGWLLWAWILFTLAVEAHAQIAHRAAPTLPGPPGHQDLAHILIAALLAAPTIAVTLTAPSPATPPTNPEQAIHLTDQTISATTISRHEIHHPTHENGTGRSATRPPSPGVPHRSTALSSNPQAAQHPQPAPGQTPLVPFGFGIGAGVGATLTAGLLLAEITRRRRRANAERRPGYLPALTPSPAAATERALAAAAHVAADLRDLLNHALNTLDSCMTDAQRPIPHILAARLDETRIDLVLAQPNQPSPPAPWQHDSKTGHWKLDTRHLKPFDEPLVEGRGDDTRYIDEAETDNRLWAWIGATQPDDRDRFTWTGTTYGPDIFRMAGIQQPDHDNTPGHDAWLLNLEPAHPIYLIGDDQALTDLARAIVLSIGQQPHANLGQPENAIGPEILIESTDPELADLAALVPHRTASAEPAMMSRIHIVDERERLDNNDPGSWQRQPPHPPEKSGGEADGISGTSPDVVSIKLVDLTASLDPSSVRLALNLRGGLHTSFTDAPLAAAAITTTTLSHIHLALAAAGASPTRPAELSQSIPGVAIPTTTTGLPHRTPSEDGPDGPPVSTAPNESYEGQGTGPHPSTPLPGSGELRLSLLGRHSATQIAERTSATSREIHSLAARLAPQERERVRDADPTLQDDLNTWYAADSPRPRLTLLGPVHVRASGRPPQRGRQAWWTEIVVLLSAHPQGLTQDQIAEHLWPQDPARKLAAGMPRQALSHLRGWLGTDPTTGQPYLPTARGTDHRGRYKIDHLLTDADLARRLRLRGTSRGPEGLDDLQTALDLVTGNILDGRRPAGYLWLTGVPLLTDLTVTITDIAHTLAIHWLTSGHPGKAIAVSRTALMAGGVDDITHLDLITACDALGRLAEADWWLHQLLAVHGASVEEDLPPSTAAQLFQRQTRHRDVAS